MMSRLKFHRVLSVIMAFAVVLASFSLTIEKHFCGSNLVAVSVLSKVESCCKNEIPANQNSQFSKVPCCSNVSLLVEGFDNYPTITTVEIETTLFTVPKLLPYPLVLGFNSKSTASNSKYKPPPRIVDIRVYHQVFLI